MKVRPDIDELFERRIVYPDFEPEERLAALVGLEEHKRRLTNILALLVNTDRLEVWAKRYHPGAKSVVKAVMARPPLVVLAGDVGSGKSALAETIGDAVARQEKIDVTLFPLSLSTRGEGRVGEMTQLLSAAFEYTIDEAKKLKDAESERSRGAVILLVDEADALAQSREASQMHHEDRAGVNAFIRGVDRLGNGKLPAAVIMCTNRPRALDPAVRRRAAEILTFTRPDAAQRREALAPALGELGFSAGQIEAMVTATGPREDGHHGFTYSRHQATFAAGDSAGRLSSARRGAGFGAGNRAPDDADGALSRRRIMSEWSLAQLLAGLHDDIQERLGRVRKSFGHPSVKGNASEAVWLELPRDLPAPALSGGHGACRGQSGRVQRADRHHRVRSPVLAIHIQLRRSNHHPGGKRLCGVRGEADYECGTGELCTKQGGERAPAASNESADPLRKGDLSGEATHSRFSGAC